MKILIKSIIFLLLIFFVCVNLSGCCSHSGGGGSSSSNVTSIGEAKVNDDGSVSFSSDGISLNAIPNTFSKGTTIKFTKVTGGDLLGYVGMSGKAITLDSDVFGIEISPQQEILNHAATVTLELSSGIDDNKKYYFAVNREIPTLVTSENISRSLSVRAATKKRFELGFVTTFSYVALAHLNKEIFADDPKVWCDNPSKEVVNNKYSSDVTIFAQLSTKDKISNVFNGEASFSLAARTDESNLTKLSHKDSPLTSRKAIGKSKLSYAYIDLTKALSVKIDEYTLQYVAFLNSINKSFNDIPRRVVIESVFTNKDNIPISSQEYLLYFRSAKRPYVINTYPSDKDIITNAAQIENIVVDFSDSMDTKSVEEAVTVTTKGSSYSKKEGNLTFAWSDNNKKLQIGKNFVLNNATGTFNVKIAKSAANTSKTNIAKDAYAVNAEDVEWSFNYKRKDFYVVMTTPEPGDLNVDVTNVNNARKGLEIVLTFSEAVYPENIESSISIKTSDNKKIRFKAATEDLVNVILTPDVNLSYNTKYIVEVNGDVKDAITRKKTLDEAYKSSFITKEPFASGSGTANDPYVITTQQELDNIRIAGYLNTDKYYKLGNDISYVKPSFTGENINSFWQPLGDNDNPFVGHFDGNNKSIKNLIVNQNDPYAGLFGKIVNSTVSNLKIDSASIKCKDIVGALAGQSLYSNISNVNINELKINATNENAGGLVGISNSSQITKCSIKVSEDIFGTVEYCGGIVGSLLSNSKLINSSFTASNNSKIIGTNYIGGLVGYVENSEIKNSNFDGTVNASDNEIGGIAGKASKASIESCKALNGAINGNSNVGGICGNLSSDSAVEKCLSSTDIAGTADNVGGLVGYSANSNIVNSYVEDKKVDNKANHCGGIVGYIKDSEIEYCYSRANVSGQDSVGGIAGSSEGTASIKNSASLSKELSGSNKDNINKVLGKGNSNIISNSYSLTNTKIAVASEDSSSYSHKSNPLDGVEKESVSAIFNNIVLDSNIWIPTNGGYPTFK